MRVLHEKEVWIVAASAVVLTLANVFRGAHESWTQIWLLYGIALLFLVLRHLYMNLKYARQAHRMNRTELGLELTSSGLRMLMPDQSIRIMTWNQLLDSRTGSRVLMLFYLPNGSRRRKYLIIPMRKLSREERHGLLALIPEQIRGKTVRRVIDQWRLE